MAIVTARERYQIQDEQYDFPYHYLPRFSRIDTPQVYAYLDWGLQYLTYMTQVREMVLDLEPFSLLDVGCGDGRLLSMLDSTITTRQGVDPSERAIAFARALVPDAHFTVATAAEINGRFDVVTCVETLEHIADAQLNDFVTSLRNRINNDGKLIITVPSTVLPVAAKHHRHYTQDLLIHQLSTHFHAVEIRHLVIHSSLSYLLTRSLSNRWFIITSPTWRRFVWRVYKKYCFSAEPDNGQHIMAIFKPK